jgi:hypothetical protein
MSKPSFVYVTYIATTPEKLWQALTDPQFTEQYWFGFRVDAQGKAGDRMTALSPSGTRVHDDKILVSEPSSPFADKSASRSSTSKKPGCRAIDHPRESFRRSESVRRQNRYVFGGVQLIDSSTAYRR